jgi:hypothetical protein
MARVTKANFFDYFALVCNRCGGGTDNGKPPAEDCGLKVLAFQYDWLEPNKIHVDVSAHNATQRITTSVKNFVGKTLIEVGQTPIKLDPAQYAGEPPRDTQQTKPKTTPPKPGRLYQFD